MRCILAVAFAVILVVAEGKVVPATNTETQEVQPMQLSDYITQAQTHINNLGAQLRENLPDQEQMINTLKEQSNMLASNIQSYVQNMSEEIKNKQPELENMWNNFKAKMNDMVTQISTNKETTEQINQLREKFEQGLQTIVTESQNTAKNIGENSVKVQEGIAQFTKQAVDMAVQASQNLQNQLHQATTPST